MKNKFSVQGKIVDVLKRKIFNGEIFVVDGKIESIREIEKECKNYILPGLVDSHVHIESSMLIPSRFAKFAVKHGVVAVVTDPHEIANVLGVQGIDFMIDDANRVPLKFYFGASSCVPATPFETSGAVLDAKIVEDLLKRNDIYFLSEMMNFPGVINEVPDVIAKLNAAKKYGKPIDGHVPGLRGKDLKKYIDAGISTDHESYTLEEAEEKIKYGMKIQIREGSAAKNFNALYKLIDMYPGMVMLCTDDTHPDDLIRGYIDKIVRMAINKNLDLFNVLQAATVVPKHHYKLDTGLLQPGDSADFIIVDDLNSFNVQITYIDGKKVYDNGEVLFDLPKISYKPNNFNANFINQSDLKVPDKGKKIFVIRAIDGELITKKEVYKPKSKNGFIVSDIESDVLKIVVLNRYNPSKPKVAFIKGFGLKKGAVATSVAHDSHNIIAIGVEDEAIVTAVNKLIENRGGLTVFDGKRIESLKLDVAGLMSAEDNPEKVASMYENLNYFAKKSGITLKAPFMTLSFMALLVIPEIKIGDKGLFDFSKFDFVDLYSE